MSVAPSSVSNPVMANPRSSILGNMRKVIGAAEDGESPNDAGRSPRGHNTEHSRLALLVEADDQPEPLGPILPDSSVSIANLANLLYLKKKLPGRGIIAKIGSIATREKIELDSHKAQSIPASLHRSTVMDSMALSDPTANIPSGQQQQPDGSSPVIRSPEPKDPPKAKRGPGRFLRLNHPGARVAFLKEHPFFKGVSNSLRERLAPQLVRRSIENHHHIACNVLKQGEEPQGSTDYLFLTGPDFAADIEVMLEETAIALLRGGAVFGQEVIFGITRNFTLGIKVPADAVQLLWVIPSQVLQALLSKPAYERDALLLKERAHTNVVSLLRSWYLHPISHINLRLFTNAEHTFKRRLAQASEMRLYAAGSFICREHEPWRQCFCIFNGEARATIDGRKVARLAHCVGMSAWAAWWGTLEVLGISEASTASVKAVSDCTVWMLSPQLLANLRADFPLECSLFDKVALEHMSMLRDHSLSIQRSSLNGRCDQNFLRELDESAETRISKQGSVIIEEGSDSAGEIYVIARGHLEVRKGLGGDSSQYVPVASLSAGDWFGEVASLGIRSTRTATVVCSTHCDLRIVTRDAILKSLAHFPDQGTHLEEMAEHRGYTLTKHDCEDQQIASLPFFKNMSPKFLATLASRSSPLAAFTQQQIINQEQESRVMFILLQGTVAILIDECLLQTIDAPAVVGEAALINPGAKSFFTVRSQTPCHFKVITTAEATGWTEEFPQDMQHLQAVARENIEILRSIVLRDFHGKRLINVARSQNAKNEEMEVTNLDESREQVPNWWAGTLFQDSDVRFLQFLSKGQDKLIYFPGEVMIQEGAEGDFALIIQEGHGFVEVAGLQVGEIKAGSFVGEAVLLGGARKRTATVRAVGVVSARTLARARLLEALDRFQEERERLEQLMALRNMANQILKVGGKLPTPAIAGGQTGTTMLHKLRYLTAGSGASNEASDGRKSADTSQSLRKTNQDMMTSARGGSKESGDARRNSNVPPATDRRLSVGGGTVGLGTVKRRKSTNAILPTLESTFYTPFHNSTDPGRRQSGTIESLPDMRRLSSATIGSLPDMRRGVSEPVGHPDMERRKSATAGADGALPNSRPMSGLSTKSPGPSSRNGLSKLPVSSPRATNSDRKSPASRQRQPKRIIARKELHAGPSRRHSEVEPGRRNMHSPLPETPPRANSSSPKRHRPFQSSEIRKTERRNLRNDTFAKASVAKLAHEDGPAPTLHQTSPRSGQLANSQAALDSSSHTPPPELDHGDRPHSSGSGFSDGHSGSGLTQSSGEDSQHPCGADPDNVGPVVMSLNYDDNDSDADPFLESYFGEQRSKLSSAGWAKERREAIAAAPLRRACRMAMRGNFKPLVPSHCGYTDGNARPEDFSFAESVQRAPQIGASRSLQKAQGVYLQSPRIYDQRSSSRESRWRSQRL